ncbi:MAG: tetratricopeptide repeat protein [Anaerolineales bacterium]|nr:tetratricopeptide repeat protein [Anaerolineales bacterium]
MTERPRPTTNVGLRLIALLTALTLLGPQAAPVGIAELLRHADATTAQQDYAAAADALAEAARRLPYDAKLVQRAGLAEISAGRFDSAIARLQSAAALSGWTPGLRVAVGDAYLGKGDRAAAIAHWEEALAELPSEDALLARLASAYEADGQFTRAAEMLNRRLQAGRREPAVLYRLALITAATAPAEAIAPLTVAAEVPSDFATAARKLRSALQEAQAQGIPAYTFGRVGYELVQLQEWALAEHALAQAVTLDPTYADAYAYLGLAQDSQGRDGQASYERAVQLAPQSPLIHYLFGLHYRRRGESAKALPYLQTAQRLDPQNPAIAAEIGGAYAAQGDLVNAEVAFTRAVELAPNDAKFWLLLARFYVDNEFKVAELGLPAARQAAGLDENSALAADAHGYALIVTGDFVNGRKQLERALALDPSLPSAYYHLGRLYQIQNKADEARAALSHALALDPQGPVGRLALQALALLP